MLINRLSYLVKNNIIEEDKHMLEYGKHSLTYKMFLDVLSLLALEEEFAVSRKVTHVHYKTENPLITLLMFYYFTSKGKVYIMLPGDLENTEDMFLCDSLLLIEGHDDLIYSLIDRSAIDKNKIASSKSNVVDKIKDVDDSILDSKLDDLFLRAYSSGTGGMRKQVERTYKSWFDAFDIQNSIFGISSDTKAYIKGDINYTGNLNYALGVIHAGGTLVISCKRGVRDLIDYIKTDKIDNVFLVPTVLGVVARYINKSDSSLDYGKNNITIVTAGEKLQEFVYRELKLKLIKARIVEYYGASEVGHISYSIDDEILIGKGYVGKPFAGVEIKIVNDKIYTSSPYHALGHEDYICAGDYGSYENDKLYIYGRGSNIISRSAKMINIEDIRSTVSSKLCCECYVRSYKDAKRGENYMLILKTDEDKNIIQNKIDLLLEKVSRPEQILLVNMIETKSSGKIDYNYYHSQIKSDLTD